MPTHPPKYSLTLIFDGLGSIQMGVDTEPEDIDKLLKEVMELHGKRDPEKSRLFTKIQDWMGMIHHLDLCDLKGWHMEVVEVKQKSNIALPRH